MRQVLQSAQAAPSSAPEHPAASPETPASRRPPLAPRPLDSLGPNVSHNAAGQDKNTGGKRYFRNERRPFGAFAPHLAKNPHKRCLEDKGRGRGKSREHGRGGVKNRPAAEVAGNATIARRLAGRRAAEHGNESAALLELAGEPLRHDLGCPIEQDDVVRRGGLPAL